MPMARHAVSFAGYLHLGLRTLVPLSVARHTVQDPHGGGSRGHKWNLAEKTCNEVRVHENENSTLCKQDVGR
jgi:hypothetical protein